MLDVQNLDAFYGQAQALFGVALSVKAGEFVVLQGLNGAGKSTLLKALMGLEVRSTGRISYAAGGQARDISRWETHRRARAGLGFVAEDRRLFSGLTVLENLLIAAAGSAAEIKRQQARVLALFPVIDASLKTEDGQEAIARTLMTQPRLLLLDEPCEGIAPVLVESIRDALLALKADGMPMLVAEQNQLLAASADRLLVLVAGKVRAS